MPRPVCQPAEIIATPQFRRDIEGFRKSYRSVAECVVTALVNEIGPDPRCGSAIPGWASLVRKLRIANKEIGAGKSGGYRLIYEWHEQERILWLLRLYSKGRMEDLSVKEITAAREASGLK